MAYARYVDVGFKWDRVLFSSVDMSRSGRVSTDSIMLNILK